MPRITDRTGRTQTTAKANHSHALNAKYDLVAQSTSIRNIASRNKLQYYCELFLKCAEVYLLSQRLRRGPFDGQLGRVLSGRCLFGQSEVADFGDVIIGYEHITSRQISVHEVTGLQILHGFTDVTETWTQTH